MVKRAALTALVVLSVSSLVQRAGFAASDGYQSFGNHR